MYVCMKREREIQRGREGGRDDFKEEKKRDGKAFESKNWKLEEEEEEEEC